MSSKSIRHRPLTPYQEGGYIKITPIVFELAPIVLNNLGHLYDILTNQDNVHVHNHAGKTYLFVWKRELAQLLSEVPTVYHVKKKIPYRIGFAS